VSAPRKGRSCRRPRIQPTVIQYFIKQIGFTQLATQSKIYNLKTVSRCNPESKRGHDLGQCVTSLNHDRESCQRRAAVSSPNRFALKGKYHSDYRLYFWLLLQIPWSRIWQTSCAKGSRSPRCNSFVRILKNTTCEAEHAKRSVMAKCFPYNSSGTCDISVKIGMPSLKNKFEKPWLTLTPEVTPGNRM
jgi:putative component of membrane protein insertase Oxa1/YidC/SpoIIIJ protein YidD